MTTQITTTNIQPAALAFIQGPVVSSIQITNSSYTVLDDTAVDTAGGYIKINGVNFVAGMNVVIGSVTATSVSVVSSTVLNVQVPAQSAGSYIVYVIAPDGGVSIVINGLTYSGTPSWVTGSTLTDQIVDTAISIQLSATGANIYSLQAGSSLPSGLTLSSGGLISGTVTGLAVDTLYNFTVEAIDTELQDSPRAFSVNILVGDTYWEYVTTLLSASTPATNPFATDASTNNFAITVAGDTRPNNFGPYTPEYYSNYFDGSGDSISLAGNAAFTMPGDFTAEAWVYCNAYTNDYAAIFGFSSDSENTGWNILVRSNGKLHFNVAMTYTDATGTLPLNQWTHVALVRSGSGSGNVKLYINGVADATTLTVTATATSPSTVLIGNYPGISSRCFNGFISNVRVVKGTAVYTSNFTPSTTPLTAIANTSLLTCQSNRFIDNSTNNFTITRNGDTSISGFDPFLPNSSYSAYGSAYFDGSGDYLLTQSTTAMNLGANPFCLEMWVYLNATGSTYYGICGSQTDYKGPSISRYNSNLMYGLSSTGSTWNILSAEGSVGSITINPYTWYHVVLCRTGNTISAYVNGARDLTITSSATLVSRTEGFCLGNWFVGLYPWNGYISNARFVVGSNPYDATQTTITVPTTPLTAIANTQLLTCQSNQPTNNSMFLDNSTNNFLITRNGNTTQGAFTPYAGTWSNYFNGSTDYFSMSDNNAFQYGADNFALECWVYPTATLSGNYIVSQWFSGDKGVILGIIGGSLAFYYSTTGSNDLGLISATNPTLNQWSHLLACRTGNTISLYLNGTRVATTTETGTLYNSSTTIGIATHVQGLGSALWPGYISNLRSIAGSNPYNAAQTTITVPTAPLTAVTNTRLLICADNRFVDDSMNRFTLTSAGSPSAQRFSPFGPQLQQTPTSYSVYFDGTGDYLTTPNNAALAFGSGDFCLEFWIYTTAFGSTDSRPLGNNTTWAANAWSLHSDHGTANEKYTFWVNNYNSGSPMFTSTSSVTLNTWTHVAITRSGNSWRMFVNGTQEGSTVTSSAALDGGSSDDMYIGGSGAANEYVTGYMSNVRAVKGAAVYTSNFTPSTTPLTAIANTSLLTCQSTTIIDNSTNAFAITVNGNSQPLAQNPFGYTNPASTAYTPATYGGSGYFDGSGDYLTAPNNAAFDFGSGNFTLETYIYSTVVSGEQHVYGKRASNSNFAPIIFGVNAASGTNRLFIIGSLNNSSWGIPGTTGSIVIPLNTFSHIAVVRSGTTIYGFVNGVLDITITNISGALMTNSDAISIGASGTNGTTPFTGYISDFRVTKGQALYNSAFVPPAAPLAPIQNSVLLLNNNSAAIYDSSMMNDLETVGNAQISTSVKKYGTGSMYFDGTDDRLNMPSSPNLAFGTGDFTLEMWAYFTSTANFPTLTDSRANTSSTAGFNLGLSSAKVQLYTTSQLLIGSSTLSANTWYHIAVTRASGTLKIWLNGVQDATVSNSTNWSDQTFVVGATPNAANFMTGYIDDLRITKGVARYTTTFTPPTSPFIVR